MPRKNRGRIGKLEEDVEEILARFDEVQSSIRTLSAEFTETTRSTLLKDAIVAWEATWRLEPPEPVLPSSDSTRATPS